MRLIALTDISDSIGTIRKDSVFVCLNPLSAENFIARKQAIPEEAPRWTGLDWRGATVAILASGESLTEEQCEAVKEWRGPDHKVIVINTTYQLAPWADVLYACDAPWWHEYAEHAKAQFLGEFWTQDETAARKYGVRHIRSVNAVGLSKQIGTIHQGANGGYQAIGLAVQAGAKRIILLGFDMHGGHWHGNHPRGLNKRQPFKDWIARFGPLAKDLEAAGIEVVNCTPGSALKCFPKMDLTDVL